MAKVYEGQRTFLSPVLGPLEQGIYRLAGIDADARVELEALRARGAAVQLHRLRRRLSAAAPAGRAAAEPAGLCRREPRLLVQHGGELRHQHQLAGLRRRDDDELSHADARTRCAELRLRGLRHGRAGRADSRVRAPAGERDRQLLGRSHAQHALHPAAAVADARDRADVAGRRAELLAVPTTLSSRAIEPVSDGEPSDAADRSPSRSRANVRSVPRRARLRSSNSAPMAAASSMSTPRIRSRTRRRCRISWRCWRSC